MERFRQNFNFAGVRLYLELLTGDRSLALPQLTVKKLRSVNWKQLKAAGMQGCVFDKDNTLTLPFKTELHVEAGEGLTACKEVFGDAVVLFSNSAGLKQYDPEGREAQHLEQTLGIPVLRHTEKKPAGSVSELESHFGCKSDSLVMIGDRLLTDIVFGNLNGMFTIYVNPFDTEVEPFGVKMGRRAENQLWADCKQRGIEPPKHGISDRLASFLEEDCEQQD